MTSEVRAAAACLLRRRLGWVLVGFWWRRSKRFRLLQVILSRQYGSEGRFTFTSHTPGEHQICLHSNSSKFSLFVGGMLVSPRPGRAARYRQNAGSNCPLSAAESSPGHPGGRARQQLRRDRRQGQADGAAAEGPAAGGAGGPDPEGAELPEGGSDQNLVKVWRSVCYYGMLRVPAPHPTPTVSSDKSENLPLFQSECHQSEQEVITRTLWNSTV